MAEKEKKKNARRIFGAAVRSDGIVTVEVGPDHVKYQLHKTFLTDHSEYFARALNGPWIEAGERKIVLEDVEPGIFNIFASYIYGYKLPCFTHQWLDIIESGEVFTEDDNRKIQQAKLIYLKSICLAERLVAPTFKKILHNSYVDWVIEDASPYPSVIYAFENLPKDDILLKLLIDKYSFSWDAKDDTSDNDYLELRSKIPHDFLLGVVKKLATMRDGECKQELPPCDYHIHNSEEERAECDEQLYDIDDSGSSDSEED